MITTENNRRNFIKQSLAASALVTAGFKPVEIQEPDEKIMTVLGPITSARLGTCLHHEHIISRFGEEPEEQGTYDYEHATNDLVPNLIFLKKLGCDSIMCCTTAYFGRDPVLLKMVAEKSGMNIIANTGYYGAANDRYVPEFAFKNAAEKIAAIWIGEFQSGIADSGVKPGFIKVGIDGGGLSDIDGKLVRAGAICHRETGLTLQVHTGNNLSAVRSQLDILKEEGVTPEAWVWIHAQNVKNNDDLLFAADRGAWISLDAIRTANYYENREKVGISVDRHLELLLFLKKNGFLKNTLLSHDGSTYPQKGKSKRSLEVLFTTFVPMMRAAGCSEDEINTLLVDNPRRAYSIKKRLA